jgi:hypothetical protein
LWLQSHAGLFNLCIVVLVAVNSRLIIENLIKVVLSPFFPCELSCFVLFLGGRGDTGVFSVIYNVKGLLLFFFSTAG